jgi:hypothetical protein
MRAMSPLVLVLPATLSACATIIHGTEQRIPIVSSPSGARVEIDSVAVGVTPVVAAVTRNRSHLVRLTHDSSPPGEIPLDRNISPWVLGNFLLYSFPAIIDFESGAAYGFSHDTLRVRLGEARPTPAWPASGIHRSTPIPAASIATAGVTSAVVGFGSGHAMVGAPRRRFGQTQFAGLAAFSIGLFLGVAGEPAGAVPFFGGALLFSGSRVWEVVDFFTVTGKHNRLVTEASRPAGQ